MTSTHSSRFQQVIGFFLYVITLITPVHAESLTVRLHGISSDLQEQVLAYLAINNESVRDHPDPAQLPRLHAQASDQIKTALQAFGYYKTSVHGELTKTEEGWEANYQIDPGEAIHINSLDVVVNGEAQQDDIFKKLLANFPLKPGQDLNHAQYELARDALLRTAVSRGYLDARLSVHDVTVNLQAYTADVALHLESGRRYRFGAVTFAKSDMNDSLLQRYVNFKQGEYYSPIDVLKLQTSLGDSGYFQRVEVRPDKEHVSDDQIPIDVDVKSRLPHQWRFGIGYATDTGARTTVSHTNLWNAEGDKLQSDLLLSEKLRRISAAYTIPQQDPITQQLGFGWRYSNEITASRDSHITGVNVTYSSMWHDWRRTYSLYLDRELYIIADQPEQTQQALYPLISLDRVSADDRLRTRNGSRIHIDVRGAREEAFSDTNFAQLRVGLKWIRSLGQHGRFITRGDFGTTNVAFLDKLPASQRFFAGGDNSVRGFGYEELGPKDASGAVVGGKHLMVGSIELEHSLSANWSAATFYDIGNAVDSFKDQLARGAGVGVRWNSPVGPVRFDFAWALSKPQDRFRLHVVIGPDL